MKYKKLVFYSIELNASLALKPSISIEIVYLIKVSYDALYEASQTFCFTTQCYQNKTFEKPHQGIVQGIEWIEILGFNFRKSIALKSGWGEILKSILKIDL